MVRSRVYVPGFKFKVPDVAPSSLNLNTEQIWELRDQPNEKMVIPHPSICNLQSEISNPKHQIPNKFQIPISNDPNEIGTVNSLLLKFVYMFRISSFGHCDLPFDLAQGAELVEPFVICDL